MDNQQVFSKTLCVFHFYCTERSENAADTCFSTIVGFSSVSQQCATVLSVALSEAPIATTAMTHQPPTCEYVCACLVGQT